MRHKNKQATEKVRLTLDVSPQFYERLQTLESLVEADTKASLIRQALQLYEFVAKKAAAGYKFRLVGPDGVDESLVLLEMQLSS